MSVIRVPLNRADNPTGEHLNVGTEHIEVRVEVTPNQQERGLCGYEYAYDHTMRRVITLREWNDQVFLHELLHVVIDPLGLSTPDDPHTHSVISRIEVALWETGWRPPAALRGDA